VWASTALQVEGVVLLELATIGISGGPQLIEGYVKQVELLLDLALHQFPAPSCLSR
jgi:hypothetical protein